MTITISLPEGSPPPADGLLDSHETRRLSLIPADCTVVGLIELILPLRARTNLIQRSNAWSKDPPTVTTAIELQAVPLPLESDLAFVRTKLVSNLFAEGYRSLVVGTARVPLGIMSVWLEWGRALKVQVDYRRSWAWLRECEASPSGELAVLSRLAMDALVHLPWQGIVAGIRPDMEHLISILRSGGRGSWGNDDVIDGCLEIVSQALALSPSQSSNPAFILPVHSFQHLLDAHFDTARPRSLFRRLLQFAETSPNGHIYLPKLINDNHWVLSRFSLATRTWEWVNSISNIPIAEDVRAVARKLEGLFPSSQPNNHVDTPIPFPPLRIGQQQDGDSCAFAVINAVEHHLLGEPLFRPSRSREVRIHQFLLLFGGRSSNPHLHKTHNSPPPPPVEDDTLLPDLDRRASAVRELVLLEIWHAALVEKEEREKKEEGAEVAPSYEELADVVRDALEYAVGFAEEEVSQVEGDIFGGGSDSEDSEESAQEEEEEDEGEFGMDTAFTLRQRADAREFHILATSTDLLSDDPDPSFLTLPSDTSKSNVPPHPPLASVFLPPPTQDRSDRNGTLAGRDSKRPPAGGGRRAVSVEETAGKVSKALAALSKSKASRQRRKAFEADCVAADAGALFDDDDPLRVFCSHHSEWVVIRTYTDSARFVQHVPVCAQSMRRPKTAKAASTSAKAKESRGSQSLTSLGFFSLPSKPQSINSSRNVKLSTPCIGLTIALHPTISKYLARTTAPVGGAPPSHILFRQLFGKAALKAARKAKRQWTVSERREVDTLELDQCKWINHHEINVIRSSKCAKKSLNRGPCLECKGLFEMASFRTALSRSGAEDPGLKRIPKKYRGGAYEEIFSRVHGVRELLGDGKETVWLRFARAAAKGEMKGHEVFCGAVEAIMETQRRKDLGLTTRGLVRRPVFVEWMHSLSLLSPIAYRHVKETLAGPTVRHFQKSRAKRPKFQLGIVPALFQQAATFFEAVGGGTHLSLAFDDSACVPKLRTFFDSAKQLWFIIGNVGNPIEVPLAPGASADDEAEDLEAILRDNNLERGSKIRVAYLSSGTPGVPSPIVASWVIGSKTSSEDLLAPTMDILRNMDSVGLLARLVSIVSDGASPERKLHDLIRANYPSKTFTIPSPSPFFAKIDIITALMGGTSTSFPIDGKHTTKNGRNAQSSGARALVLGNFFTGHGDLEEMVEDPNSPSLKRDVHKRDRQCDRVAERWQSTEMMDYATKMGLEKSGFVVYLFIIGELHSAVQNRALPHLERQRMILTVWYFLEGWEKFTKLHPDYTTRNFLGSDFVIIVRRLILGLIGITRTVRDEFTGEALFLWRHTTEMLEHLFATARRHQKDFDALDFCHMATKLAHLMEQNLSALDEAGNRAAEGYHHTYNDLSELDVDALSTFFTDQQLLDVASLAATDVLDLFKGLGMYSLLQSHLSSPTISSSSPPQPPSPSSPPELEDSVDAYLSSHLGSAEGQLVNDLILRLNKIPNLPASLRNATASASLGLVALEVEISDKLAALPEDQPEELLAMAKRAVAKVFSKERRNLLSGLNPINGLLFHPPILTSDETINFAALVERRRSHECAHTRKSLRRHGGKTFSHAEESEKPRSAQAVRSKTFARLVRQVATELDGVKSTSTAGLERALRWIGTASTGRKETEHELKKREVLRLSNSKAALVRREARYSRWKTIPQFAIVVTGGVTEEKPLNTGNLVAFGCGKEPSPRVSLGIVRAMYRKDSPTAPHSLVTATSDLSSLSNVVVQELRHIEKTTFSLIKDSELDVCSFHHIPGYRILMGSTSRAEPVVDSSTMVTVPSHIRFAWSLLSAQTTLKSVCIAPEGRPRKRKAAETDEEDSGASEVE
ncbi:hypothetical protein P7C70_g5513, partial [Phenoliferia sp. Uapishka_3]